MCGVFIVLRALIWEASGAGGEDWRGIVMAVAHVGRHMAPFFCVV